MYIYVYVYIHAYIHTACKNTYDIHKDNMFTYIHTIMYAYKHTIMNMEMSKGPVCTCTCVCLCLCMHVCISTNMLKNVEQMVMNITCNTELRKCMCICMCEFMCLHVWDLCVVSLHL